MPETAPYADRMLRALIVFAGLARLSEPLPYWSSTASLPMPQTRLIVASPSEDETLYAVAADLAQASALFQSVDAGASWIELAPLPAGEQIASLAIDPGDPLILLMTTTRSDTHATTTAVYRSSNGGTTWSLSLDPGIYCGPVGFAREGAVALIGCGSQLYRTLDGGENWEAVPNPASSRRFSPGPDDSVFAFGDNDTILRTADDGSTWTVVGSTPPQCSDVTWLAVSPSNRLELLVGAYEPHVLGILCGGIFRSEDGGATWEDALDRQAVTQIEYDVHSPSRVFASVAPSGFATNAPFSGVRSSDDGGRTWNELPPPEESSDFPIGIAVSASGRGLYASSGTVFAHRYRRPVTVKR
jgi:photosystem II stability/assembly factor-like uncharacterized protein